MMIMGSYTGICRVNEGAKLYNPAPKVKGYYTKYGASEKRITRRVWGVILKRLSMR
jgi:hypothetical protein